MTYHHRCHKCRRWFESRSPYRAMCYQCKPIKSTSWHKMTRGYYDAHHRNPTLA
jgi:hypothetical protein